MGNAQKCNPPTMGIPPKIRHAREKNSTDSDKTLKKRVTGENAEQMVRLTDMNVDDTDKNEIWPGPTLPMHYDGVSWEGWGGQQEDPCGDDQNMGLNMDWEDERDNWDAWAAIIDAKVDAMMEH